MRLSVGHSFRFRLSVAMMVTTVTALLCAARAFLFFHRFALRRELGLSLATQAEMIGDNTAAAIAFDALGTDRPRRCSPSSTTSWTFRKSRLAASGSMKSSSTCPGPGRGP